MAESDAAIAVFETNNHAFWRPVTAIRLKTTATRDRERPGMVVVHGHAALSRLPVWPDQCERRPHCGAAALFRHRRHRPGFTFNAHRCRCSRSLQPLPTKPITCAFAIRCAKRWPNPSDARNVYGGMHFREGLIKGAIQARRSGVVFRHALRPLSGDGNHGRPGLRSHAEQGIDRSFPASAPRGWHEDPGSESVHRPRRDLSSRACLHGRSCAAGASVGTPGAACGVPYGHKTIGSDPPAWASSRPPAGVLITTAARERPSLAREALEQPCRVHRPRCWPTCAASAIHRPMPKTSPKRSFGALHRTRLGTATQIRTAGVSAACC